jgi:DNA invertase Pin-like site-specific DNA recombinase
MSQESYKVTASHLSRNAYLYIRQSSLQQVIHNTESTQRQYDLRRRAVALGWQEDQIIVIDKDLGQSGASAKDRAGFQMLVSDVGLGKAGIVLGLEVSRLARNSADWHRLLEICALSGTLILDEDGLYNPSCFNDRLLLGMKGTMSEAELHILSSRLQGGIRNKARRGELRIPLPVGLSYDLQDKVVLAPDKEVQDVIAAFFKEFKRVGSASGVVTFFKREKVLFPRMLRGELNKGKIIWGPLTHSRALYLLHNPRYAGTFVYGRTKLTLRENGKVQALLLPLEDWQVVIPDSHPGYINWQEYNDNQKTLKSNSSSYGEDRRSHPPGKGPSLLQGLLICGVCGLRMTLRYNTCKGKQKPTYVCQRQRIEYSMPVCQNIPGGNIDDAVGELLLKMVKPLTLELAMTVQQEVNNQLKESDKLRYQAVERLQYMADTARERFMRVDPKNRLVADRLEADWNGALQKVNEAREVYEEQREKDQLILDEKCRKEIMDLASDFPRIWRDPQVSNQDRKRIVRLLIEDVTLTRDAKMVKVQIRFKGGKLHEVTLPIPKTAWQKRMTTQEVVNEVDSLLNTMTDEQVAKNLNRRGIKAADSKSWTSRKIMILRQSRGLVSLFDRLRKQDDLLTLKEMALELSVSTGTVRVWYYHGLLEAYDYNSKGDRLYKLPPENERPKKQQGYYGKLSERKQSLLSQRSDGVHHE